MLSKEAAAPAHEKPAEKKPEAAPKADAAKAAVDKTTATTADQVKAAMGATGPAGEQAPIKSAGYEPTFKFMGYNPINKPPFFGDALSKTAKGAMILPLVAMPPTGLTVGAGYLGYKALRKIPGLSLLDRKRAELWQKTKNAATKTYNATINVVKSPLVAADYISQKIILGLSKRMNLVGPDGQPNKSGIAVLAASLKEILYAPIRATSLSAKQALKHPWYSTLALGTVAQSMGLINIPSILGKIVSGIVKGLSGAP